MSGKVEGLRASRDGYSVHWMRFLKLATRAGDRVICVFEGEDAKYFGSRLDSIAATAWLPANVGGRENVLAVLDLSRRTKQYYLSSYFFIDRDFEIVDEPGKDPRLYVTPTYSVENLYCTDAAFQRILRDEFGCPANKGGEDALSSSVDCHERVSQAFYVARASFLLAVKDINAWAACHRRREAKQPGYGRLLLNDLDIMDHVSVGLDECAPSYDLADLHRAHSGMPFPSSEEMAESRDILEERGLLETCRGKFIAEFLRCYLAKLKEDAYVATPSFVTNGAKPKLAISKRNFLSELTQFADTPRCLREFLMKISNVSESAETA